MTRNALVLGGGGARGSYEIGVWKALRFLNWEIHVVTGTSVGSLNGALIAQDDFDIAIELWDNIQTSMIIDLEEKSSLDDAIERLDQGKKGFGSFSLKGTGLSTAPLGQLLQKYVREEDLRNSPIDFGVVTVELSPPTLIPRKFFVKDIEEGFILDYLWASSSLYPALQAHKIKDAYYIDGGYHDNVPIDMALEKNVNNIVAVDLKAIGFIKTPEITENQTLTTIRSYWDLGHLLSFNSTTSQRNLLLGYWDTMKAFKKAKGFAYTLTLDAFTKQDESIQHRMKQLQEIIYRAEDKKFLSFAKESTLNALKRKYSRDFSLDNDLWQLGAECAGEIFGVAAEHIYTEEGFMKALHLKIGEYTLQQKVMDHFGFHKLLSIKKKLTSLDAPGRVISLKKYIDSSTIKKAAFPEEALAVLFPQEFMAAAFLWIHEIKL